MASSTDKNLADTSFILHPAVAWQRVGDDRLQLRVPSGQHVTFDQNIELIESMLNWATKRCTADDFFKEYGVENHEFVSQFLQFLLYRNCALVEEVNSNLGVVTAVFDYYARIVGDAKSHLPDPYISNIKLEGSGHVFDITSKVVDELKLSRADASSSDNILRVHCCDHEHLPQMREFNKSIVANNEKGIFVYWNGAELVIGPFIVPKESACFECYLARRMANSYFGDELESLMNQPANIAKADLPSDSVLEGLVQFAVGRQLSLISMGVLNIVEPGQVLAWEPLRNKTTVSSVLRKPRCTVCGRVSEKDPGRAIRDLV